MRLAETQENISENEAKIAGKKYRREDIFQSTER